MTAASPNPFDPDDPIEVLNYWRAQGQDSYATAVGTILDTVLNDLVAAADELDNADVPTIDRDADVDTIWAATRLGESVRYAGERLYNAGCGVLRQVVGRPSGENTTDHDTDDPEGMPL